MNKKGLTAQVATTTGLTKKLSAEVIDAVFHSLRENIENRKSTVIQGFGSFSIANRVERMGVNPSTKKPMIIPTRRVVKFSISKKIEIG